jgi:hypothetical protein
MMTLMIISSIPVFNGIAQAYDPRAEVPGATITGLILDANGNNIPNATVKLLLDGQLFDIPRNPQQSNSDNITDQYGTVGRYQFMRLPYGQYLIVAEMPDASGTVHRSNLSVNVNANTVTADIVLADLVNVATGTPSPLQASSVPPPTPPREPCGLGLVIPIIGISVLMIRNKTIKK